MLAARLIPRFFGHVVVRHAQCVPLGLPQRRDSRWPTGCPSNRCRSWPRASSGSCTRQGAPLPGRSNGPSGAPVKARGRRVGGRVRCLAVERLLLLLLLVLLVGCSPSTGWAQPDAADSAQPSRLALAWAPPSCGDQEHRCVDLYLSNSGSHQTPSLDNDTDYRIHLPANGPLVGGIPLPGGRHVIIVGGEIDLTYPCSN